MKGAFLAALAVASIFVVVACSSPKETPIDPPKETASSVENLDGNWAYSQDEFSFEAVIDNDEINIFLTLEDAKGLYWAGTFQSEVSGSSMIDSTADQNALDASVYGSTDRSKLFKYEDGKISYEFSIMGLTYDVVLERV